MREQTKFGLSNVPRRRSHGVGLGSSNQWRWSQAARIERQTAIDIDGDLRGKLERRTVVQRAVGWVPAARAGEATGERGGPAVMQGAANSGATCVFFSIFFFFGGSDASRSRWMPRAHKTLKSKRGQLSTCILSRHSIIRPCIELWITWTHERSGLRSALIYRNRNRNITLPWLLVAPCFGIHVCFFTCFVKTHHKQNLLSLCKVEVLVHSQS